MINKYELNFFTAALGAALLAATAAAQTNAGAPAEAGDKMDELFGDTVVAKGKGLKSNAASWTRPWSTSRPRSRPAAGLSRPSN